MKKSYFKIKICLAIVFTSIFAQTLTSQTSEPFNCVTEAYLFQSNDVYAQNLASGSAILDAIDITPNVINGVGYNSKDGYIWGSLKSPANTIVRIGKDYEVTTYTLSNAPYSYVGDVNQDGVYFLKNGSSSFYKIDLDPESPTYLTNIGSQALSQAITNHDWAFNAADDMLYTVEKHSNILYRIDTTTGNVEALGEVPILSGLNYTYGAVYFDVDGNFYISANQTGTVYIVYEVQNITVGGSMKSNLFAFGPSSSQNDGARCPTAPVPQEDCTNGVDDDGDGLVDCDDPACSGVAACPTITRTSSGNDGGLESNNRLASQISQRNINRIKRNYTFNKKTAKRVKKNSFYGMKSANQTISLWDFVPMDIIPEATAIESSPGDLVDITNAIDLVSVDYLKGNDNVGTLLVLETQDEVYEHTKHICDRFTGAELLSVSTMEINEATFIKSVVKQPDGSVEYVASFSVRVSEDSAFFIAESHWNLDQYSDTGFYNFQVWANSVDDLYNLSQEVIRLIEIQKPIASYISSQAPPVYVRKASYMNGGKINLEVINTLSSESITIEGFKRATETSEIEPVNLTITAPNYVNNITLEVGSLYDIGFRVRNALDISPDDLFLSDGTWGIDYSSENYIDSFEVIKSDISEGKDAYNVERGIVLTTTTNQDVSIYRSLTPKFEPVDVSNYNQITFKAKGDGKLKLTFIKDEITSWEEQPYLMIELTENEKEYVLHNADIIAAKGGTNLNDIKMLLFTLVSEDVTIKTKKFDITDIQFSKQSTASLEEQDQEITARVVPNPIVDQATFNFEVKNADDYILEIYNLLGKRVFSRKIQAVVGKNKVVFYRNELSSGAYLYSLNSSNQKIKGKILLK
ncbi:DUF6923 family protein [Tenacibaculum agarivorans]|uniref:DUF6923 family protein n=1 Tax=Tenacibaculum agarivorans TaxID=1908389 RepID=UPI00094BB901|nr:T9SS type A sorting domain-containing protein [Tenacibaculum agarivorans]